MKGNSTYRIILAWSLLFIYSLNSFRTVQPYLEYNLNYDYISNVLCVNKEKPEVKCNGKCYLTKELKKAAQEKSEKKETTINLIIEILPTEETGLTLNANSSFITEIKFPPFSQSVESLNTENITPPPRA
jgi:hypothetical protein